MPSRGLGPLQVPEGFWLRDDVTEALDRRDVGRMLYLVRQHSGASQTRIGAAVDLSQGTISDVINGKRTITSFDVLRRVAAGLDMPEDARVRLGLASASSAAPTHGAAKGADPDALTDVLSTASVSDRDLDFIERAVYSLAQRYPVAGPALVWPVASAHLARLQEIVARPQRLSVHRRAVGLIGVLSGIVGNVWIDNGRQQRAAQYFGVGRLAGHETGDDNLTAWVCTMESIAPFFNRSPHYAANLLDQAHELSASSGRRRKAWIAALRARAYAKIDPVMARGALDEAFTVIEDAEPPAGTDFFDIARLYGLAGSAHLLMGDPATATGMTRLALAGRPDTDVKGRAILTLDLAAAEIEAHEPDEASRLILEALSVGEGQLVQPIVTRARDVAAGMTGWRTTPAVRQVNDRLRALSRRPAVKE